MKNITSMNNENYIKILNAVKNISVVLLFMILSGNRILSQTIEIDKVDEFTGEKMKTTSWEKFNFSFSSNFIAYGRFMKMEDEIFFNLKMRMTTSKVFSMDKGEKFMIKMKSGEIIELRNTEYEISCIGCGSPGLEGSGVYGVDLKFRLSNSQIESLIKEEAYKVRINTSIGYVEDLVKPKYFKRFQNGLILIK